MTRDELIEELRWAVVVSADDTRAAHIKADRALVDFINDQEILDLFLAITKHYS